jgi:hypothetical protein
MLAQISELEADRAEVLWVLVGVAFAVFPIWGIIDAALRPDDVWARANQSKVVWILVQIFLWTLGALIYFIAIRPKLTSPSRSRPRSGRSG